MITSPHTTPTHFVNITTKGCGVVRLLVITLLLTLCWYTNKVCRSSVITSPHTTPDTLCWYTNKGCRSSVITSPHTTPTHFVGISTKG